MDLTFNKNEDYHKLQLSDLRKRLSRIKKGGGDKRIEKLHAEGKMTARERIDYLLDTPGDALEIGAFAGYEMYADYGGCPSGGVVVKVGHVQGRLCVVVANDATVKAGAWFPITGKKNLRAQEIAMENRLPIVYLVDSAGVFLPMQDEIFPQGAFRADLPQQCPDEQPGHPTDRGRHGELRGRRGLPAHHE